MIVCDRLVRIYTGIGIEVQALQGLDLLIAEGELTALIGAAGTGKSTLMNILAGLDTPTAGMVWVAGHNLGAMTARERLAYRRDVTGFVWQQTSRNLLPYLTARQNVLLPMRLSSFSRREHRRRAACCSTPSASRTAPTGPRTACRVVSSNAPPSPPRWPTSRRCCWPTNRPASSTPPPPGTCSLPCRPPTPGSAARCWWSPTTRPCRRRSGDDRDQGRQDEQRDDTARGHRRPRRDHGPRPRIRQDAGPGGRRSAPA